MNWISHVYNTTLILTHTQKNKELSSNTSTSRKKRRKTETNRNSQAKKKRKKEAMTSLQEGTQIAQYWYLQSLPNTKNFERWVWLPGTVTTTSDIETTKDEEDKDQEGFNTRIKWDTIKLDGKLVYEGDTCDETLLMKDHLKEFAEIECFQNQDNWVHGSFANKVLKWQNNGGLKGLNDTKCILVEDKTEEESSSEETEEESSSSVSPYIVVVYIVLHIFTFEVYCAAHIKLCLFIYIRAMMSQRRMR